MSLAFSEALIAAGMTESVGTVVDSCANALAETVNGLYKTEIICSRRVWASATSVDISTLEWVHWWNTAHLHVGLEDRIPVEIQASYTVAEVTATVVS